MKNKSLLISIVSMFIATYSVAQVKGAFIDSRDNKTYKTVKIGTQMWMAENLNYSSGNSWCYNNDSCNCTKYGRLYDWETAIKVCPSGWRLPSKSDFETLLTNPVNALKEGGSSGFSALLGGWRYGNGSFSNIGDYGDWWSSSEKDTKVAWYMNFSIKRTRMIMYLKKLGFSVRCLQD